MRPLGGQIHTHVTSILIRPCGGCQCDVAPNCCHRKLSNGKRKRRPCPSITLHSLVEWWHWHGGMAHFLLSANPISAASLWDGGGRRSRRSNWFSSCCHNRKQQGNTSNGMGAVGRFQLGIGGLLATWGIGLSQICGQQLILLWLGRKFNLIIN